MKTIRVGVIGVGHLGQHHARLLQAIDGAELVGVYDTNQNRAAEIVGRHGSTVVRDPGELLSMVDAVTIAAPTVHHTALALPFLTAGIATLVEKPMASHLEEADRLIAAADDGRALLAVGHTERFNPAVVVARPLVTDPRFIEVHRLGTFPERSLDIDVIFDVMIHDLDLILALVGSDVVSIEAVGVHVLTSKADIANARLRFASGCIANITASRISRERVRRARFFQHDAYVSIDFGAQEVEMYRLDRGGTRPVIQGGAVAVAREEPLRRELEDFVDAVRTGRAPGVTGRDGRAALALATRVAEKMEGHEHVSSTR